MGKVWSMRWRQMPAGGQEAAFCGEKLRGNRLAFRRLMGEGYFRRMEKGKIAQS